MQREKDRCEIFNFKDPEGIQRFQELTSSTTLSKCFKNKDIVSESKQWLKKFKNILQRSFKKIRITKPRQKSEIIVEMREKARIMQKLETLQQRLEMSSQTIAQNIIYKLVLIKIEFEEIEISISNKFQIIMSKRLKSIFLL